MNIVSELNSINKFRPTIRFMARKYGVDEKTLIGIILLENFNRPHWFRFLENITPTFIYRVKSFGITQVSSNRNLTEEKSIELTAQYISKWSKNIRNNPVKLGEKYNGLRDYGVCLKYITESLSTISNKIDKLYPEVEKNLI